MTTRFYKVPGSSEYVTWDYLHNSLGYTTIPTEAIGYKSTIDWGADAGTGYCSTDTGEWFVQGQVGWYSLSHLAWDCDVYPGNATELKVEKSGTESNAASLILDGTTEYWLIESQLEDGWCTRAFWEGEGWSIVEEHTYEFILVDATTGRVTSGVERIDEIVFAEAGYFTIDDTDEVIFVEESPFPVVCTHSGTQTATSIAADASFDTGLQYYASKLYIGETNDGQGNVTRYGWEAEEGTAPAYIDVNFYYRPEGTSVTFGANDYWGSIVVGSTSKGILEAFGVSLYNYSGSGYCVSKTGNSGFTFEILGLYSGTTDLGADLTNFYLENGSGVTDTSPYYGLNIKSRNAYSTSTNYWKCRITRNS